MLAKIFEKIVENHKGKAIGIFLGLAFGWFAITYGFFKALFVAFCIIIGYFIGRGIDERFDFRRAMDWLFRDRW